MATRMTAASCRGTEANANIRQFDRKQASPWTKAQLERVRVEAIALVRSHRSYDLGDDTFTLVGGREYWRLLAALDRERAWEESS